MASQAIDRQRADIEVRLPDGTTKAFDKALSVLDIAHSIGAGLAQAAVAGRVDGQLVDVGHIVDHPVDLQIITAKSAEGLEVIRHSCAHLMAQAVKALFPEAQVTIGPVIEDGFYYDFALPRPLTPEDLETIERHMKTLVKQKIPVERLVMAPAEAIDYFKGIGEDYKVEIIGDIDPNETLSLYRQGDFMDLCRGPHVPHTGFLKVFKLTKLAGAYWRGDSNNAMLQRIYGTAWGDKKDLKQYLERQEQAKLRDHRRLAKKLDLYHIQEEAPGMIFWHENGYRLWQTIESYLRERYRRHGYQEIKTPQIIDIELWKKSGHADKYLEEMFLTGSESREFAIKPMNCPGHVQVFNQGLKSHRDLPIRLAEFGCCHRNEPSGAMHGLMRVRGFVQDDGHIFCAEDAIQTEVKAFIQQAFEVYEDFGFDQIELKLATRPEKRIGEDAIWDKAEAALEQAFVELGLSFDVLPGEGAFYGPKIEFHLKDCLARTWQCGTIQVDFAMPKRLGAHYVAEDNSKQTPVMLHRAIIGSMERFMGILIEHYAGVLPLWLAPVQVVVLGVSEKYSDFVCQVTENLKKNGIIAREDLRNEKIGYKIRDHAMSKVPYMVILGEKELSSNQLTVRDRQGQDLGSMSHDQLIERLKQDIENKQ